MADEADHLHFATARSAPVLRARGVSKRFGGIVALSDVDLAVQGGEIHALMGENGAGKSTLMKILAGVYTDYQGQLELDGQPIAFSSVRQAEAAGIAIIHQELNLVPELSVADNIFLGREPRIAGLVIDRRRSSREARALLKRLGISLDPSARVGPLRVGEQQLVEIAKALSLDARVLIMDEPTSALSPAECERLFQIIRQLAKDGVAIIYISHRLDEILQLAQRVTVFRDGRHVLTQPIGELTEDRIVAAMVGRELLAADYDTPAALGRTVLSVRDLKLAVPHRNAWRDVLHGVTFDLAEGEVLGIGGLLGAGRTEILESLFGASDGVVSGGIEIDGRAVEIRSPADARRLGLALVTEDRKAEGLHLEASIVDNVALPLVSRLSRYGVRAFAAERRQAQGAVKSLNIRCSGVDQAAGRLSGGNQQKVVIGKWLATKPRILLLDEPTRGIDVGAKREIYDLIFKLAREDGIAIVFVSSEMPELLLLADRILVMSEGRQRGILARADATQERVMQLAAPARKAA